tara:strand:+ start:9702 stop:10847 length:1146 start_codon:yes stop_codon:yes gene_type:complete
VLDSLPVKDQARVSLLGAEVCMDKRYQVFVSSTFWDLEAERRAVMQALLQSDCIPAGMELFPASDEESFELIKSVIDDCDYYLVIVGGRYGGINKETGLSYTEMEYQYALERGLPIAAFPHKDPGSLPAKQSEDTEEGKAKLKNFLELIGGKAFRKWDNPDSLSLAVMQSIHHFKKRRPAIGWVRGDQVPSEDANAEILRLRKKIEELEASAASDSTEAPAGTEIFAQGHDTLSFLVAVRYNDDRDFHGFNSLSYTVRIDLEVSSILREIGPLMLAEASEADLQIALGKSFGSMARALLEVGVEEGSIKVPPGKWRHNGTYRSCAFDDSALHTVVVQLFALELIRKSEKKRSVKDQGTYWSLTKYGEGELMRLRAVKRNEE